MLKYRSYNGDKEYIFVSFSEKDEEQAEYILEKLIPNGYRIRLEDKGAAAYSTVNDLVNSQLMLLVLTDNYIADPPSYRLLQKAETLRKPIIVYVPEDTPTVKEVLMRLIRSPEMTLIFRPGEEIADSKSAEVLLEPTLGLTPALATKLFIQASAQYEKTGNEEALDYIKLAASENCSKAILWLGKRALRQAHDGKERYSEAVSYLFKAAKLGDTEAIYILGKMLLDGDGFDRNPQLAYTYILKSARHGYPKAQLELAEMYDKGIGTEIDKALATKWYIAAADKGEIDAFIPLGIRYMEGLCVEKNIETAVRYLNASAENKNADADLILAHHYRDESSNTEPDLVSSTAHFKAAAEAGLCEAQYFYSLCLKKGIGCKRDRKKAFYWMKRAASDRADGAEGSPDALYQLGIYYHKGIGCKKNHKKAFICYYYAARQGHGEALHAVSECYRRGIGVSVNRRASALFRRKQEKRF